MKPTKLLASLAVTVALCLASPFAALAQGRAKPKSTAASAEQPKKVRNYDFTGDKLDGEIVNTDVEWLDTRKIASHTSLIRLRKDFIKEIGKSADDL